MIANTPKPPYFAVIFSSLRTEGDMDYSEMSTKMLDLAHKQQGFLGAESVREELGITVSYWKDMRAIKKWKMNMDHVIAQKLGKQKWYKHYKVRIAKVERDYEFTG